MFCTNCGAEVAGKFCANCGTPVNTDTQSPSFVDPAEVLSQCGGKKIEAIKMYRDLTGVSLPEGKRIIDAIQKEQNPAPPTPTFKEAFAAQIKESQQLEFQKRQDKTAAKQAEKDRIAAVKASGEVYCPKCYSTSVTADKKGFGIGKAVVGTAMSLGNPLGLMAGNINAKKVRITCMKCDYNWLAGKK